MNTPFSPELLARLSSARRVVALTGAGVSAASGIATFRDPGGLWSRFRPEELANVDAFLANPTLVQAWYAHRRDIVTRAVPNPGHRALVDLAGLVPSFALVTQNVDGLHQRAGSADVIELHGNINRSYCADCGFEAATADLVAPGGQVVRCVRCHGLVRPDVVWFGEMLPEDALGRAVEASRQADVFLTIGTSAVVYPAADLPLVAAGAGARLVEVNVEPSAIADRADDLLVGSAADILPALVAAIRTLRSGSPAPLTVETN